MDNLVTLLLLQAQLLLNDADEANHPGDFGTFVLQCQAREVLAEAIDRLTAEASQATDTAVMNSVLDEVIAARLRSLDAGVTCHG